MSQDQDTPQDQPVQTHHAQKELYFGGPMESFSQNCDRELGSFDKMGHFVFKQRKKDAWLDHIQKQPSRKVADKIVRKKQQKAKRSNQFQQLQADDLLQILVQMLPQKTSASTYIKQLKLEKSDSAKQLIETTLNLISALILKTHDYSLPTYTRQRLADSHQQPPEQEPQEHQQS